MSSDVLVTTPAQRQTEPHAEAVSRNRRQQATFRKVLAAAMATLREKSYADLTVRLVAARAKVAPATAYTYFSSKNHLIAEVYLDLVRQVPCVTDVKNFVGIQNLVAHEPMLQPQTPNGSINPAECWPAVGGGVPSAYDLGTVIGFYGLTIDEPPTGTAPNQVGQLIVAFRDAATAQRHLADLASIWRRCGGRTVTLFRSEWRRPVELSTSVPEVVDGITTMVLTAQGPVLRVREDHAIAAKNNVLVDVDIMTPDTSRGQQAVIGITNYILAKIPG